MNPFRYFSSLFTMSSFGSLVGHLLAAGIASYFLMRAYQAIPERHRQLDPHHVWLLLIPVFHMVWCFIAFPRLSDSYKAALAELDPDADVGDCGKGIAIAYCILVVASYVSCVGSLASAGALILLIVFIIKALELHKRVVAAGDPLAPQAPQEP